MNGTTTFDLAAAWTAAMTRARADLPGAHDDDLLVSAVLAVRLA